MILNWFGIETYFLFESLFSFFFSSFHCLFRSIFKNTTDCPAGKWSDKVQADNINDCLDCQIGKYSASLSIDVDCIFCPAGTRGKNGVTGGTNITVCQACAEGHYRNGSDSVATSCRKCPMGYYNDDVGQGSCLPCIPVSFIVENVSFLQIFLTHFFLRLVLFLCFRVNSMIS